MSKNSSSTLHHSGHGPTTKKPSYRMDQFMHIVDGQMPWWFTKSEIEQLVTLLKDYNQDGRWKIQNGPPVNDPSLECDDRIVIRGGEHDFYIRKRYMLVEGRSVFETQLGDEKPSLTKNYADVKTALLSYVDFRVGLNNAIDCINKKLTLEELNHH